MRVTINMLQPGMRLYHVYAFSSGSPSSSIELKTYIGPYTGLHSGPNFSSFDYVGGSQFKNGTLQSYLPGGWRTHGSLQDMGIIPNQYNQHRTYSTWHSACDYLMSVMGVKFPYPPNPFGTEDSNVSPLTVVRRTHVSAYDKAMKGF